MTSTEIMHAVETSIAKLSDDDRVVWLRYSIARKLEFWGVDSVWWIADTNDTYGDRLQVVSTNGSTWLIKRFVDNPFRIKTDYLPKAKQRYSTLGQAIIELLKSLMTASGTVQ